MAKPRVFISSTFFDLQQVRADLESFVKQMGFDPVLNERGTIPYGSEDQLEQYCYRELDKVDIVISIVGNRFGTESQHQPYSISQMELRTAHRLGKQIYIYVLRSVMSELQTYRKNKEKGIVIELSHADDPRIYDFLTEVVQLSTNNATAPFDTAQEIVENLREQWAGLFQRFLQDQIKVRELNAIEELRESISGIADVARTLREIGTERKQQSSTPTPPRPLLTFYHPLFKELNEFLSLGYRVYFRDISEMLAWFKDTGWREESESFDEFWRFVRDSDNKTEIVVTISTHLFPENNLRVLTQEQFAENPNYIDFAYRLKPSADSDDTDPFADE